MTDADVYNDQRTNLTDAASAKAECFRLAISQLTDALASTVNAPGGDGEQQQLTFADIVRTGAVFCKLIGSLSPESGGRFADEELQFIEGILSNLKEPEALSAILLARMETGQESAEELAQLPRAIFEFMERPQNVRQFLQKLIREIIPPNPPGRKRKIDDKEIPELLARAEQLRPALMALAQVLRASRNSTLPEALQFLQKEYPEECEYLLKHVKQLEILRADHRLTARAKTIEAKMRIVADAIAGAEHDISARYSVQLVEQERRSARRKARKALSQKI